MSILDQFRDDKVAVENTNCTLQELNDVLSYLLCRKTKVNGLNYYYLNNKDMQSEFSTNYTRKPSYPVSDFLKAIEQEKAQEWEKSKIQDKFDKFENELKASNAIRETLEMLEKDMQEDGGGFEDTPFKISITQCGVKYSAKTNSSDVSIYEVKNLLVSLLKASGFQDQTIKEIFKDEI